MWVDNDAQVEHMASVGRANRTHGMAHGAEWKVYYGMLGRCYSPSHKSYARYGGRGITVCARWLESFENFVADMGNRPDGMTLERDRVNDGYSKDNCRWATPREQANNRTNNVLITAHGKSMTAPEWERETGIRRTTIEQRIRNGWNPDRAVSDPPIPRGKDRLNFDVSTRN